MNWLKILKIIVEIITFGLVTIENSKTPKN